MKYYLVAVGNARYHGREPLTYSFDGSLSPGAIVEVPLQKTKSLGFIVAGVPQKPEFPTKALLRSFPDLPPLPKPSIDTFERMRTYYPAPLGILTQLFLPKDLPERTVKTRKQEQLHKSSKPLPPLTAAQAEVASQLHSPGTTILHGETGSGKTRLYIACAQKAIAEGKSCIILTPEISLTSQLAQTFASVFTDNLHVIHSHLTPAARRKHWLELASAKTPQVVIGPRSALFSPLASIGLIVIDEAHDSAYKQDNTPHYHATRVAAMLAQAHGAPLILGSATPSVHDYFLAQQTKRPIVRLTQPAIRHETHNGVTVTTVDMKNKDNLSSTGHFSNQLIAAMHERLAQNQQTLLFLNRRGTARVILCAKCGWQAACPHCDLPLTYHHDSHTLRCHICTYHTAAVTSCPTCGNADITLKSIGTKAIMTAVQKLFPTATVARFDADNKEGERVHELYEDIHSGKIDILVGTQMLAKGLDLPQLGLVGIINADSSLYIPDFTAQERTYQMIYQLIGRVGRGHSAGYVVIQTYTPENPTLQAAATKDWATFYDRELTERKAYLFPPYVHVLKLSCRRASTKSAIAAAEKVAERLYAEQLPIRIEGPAPAFHEKVQNKYVWQLVIKAKHRHHLLRVIELLPSDWSHDIDPVDLL